MTIKLKTLAAIAAACMFTHVPAALAQTATDPTTQTSVPVDRDDGDEGKWGWLGLLGLVGLMGLKRRDREYDRDNRTAAAGRH